MLILRMVVFLTHLILHDFVVVLFCHLFKFVSCFLVYGYYYTYWFNQR